MGISLICVEFILIFLIRRSSNFTGSIVEIFIETILIFSSIIVLTTEIINLFFSINQWNFIIAWIILIIFSSLILRNKNTISIIEYSLLKKNFLIYTQSKTLLFNLIFWGFIVFLLLIQGYLYPPNNWDSMTYHMARVTNWIGNESINHYPTHIFRQLYQPPFSSFFTLHLTLLTKLDFFSNSIQLFYLLGSIASLAAIFNLFNYTLKTKIIGITLILTIPEVLLQASSTQNDIIVSFFIVSCSFFSIKSYKSPTLNNFIFLGLSIGLALSSKATAYLYLTPLLLIFGFYLLKTIVTKNKTFQPLIYSLIVIPITILLNLGHYSRNYELSGSFLGVDKNESKMYSNQSMTPRLLLLNILKNGSLHFGPFPINKISEKATIIAHNSLEIETNNSETNYLGVEYQGAPNSPNHEDTAPNFFHFYLIIASILILGIKLINKTGNREITLIFLIGFFLEILLFCGYLKWQIWNTRIHTPLFLISIPMILYSFSSFSRLENLLKKFLPLFIFYAVFLVVFNKSRPFITTKFTHNISINDDRYKKYFANRLELYPEYENIVSILSNYKNKKIGLILNVDDWEYPLFSRLGQNKLSPKHIDVKNISNIIPSENEDFEFIVSTKSNETSIEFDGKIYINLTSENTEIWLYRTFNQ